MSENPQVTDPTPQGAISDPGGSPSPDPRDARIAELERFYSETAPFLETLRPYEEDIKGLVEDEDLRNFTRSSREQYLRLREERKKAQEPAVDPAIKAAADLFYERVKPELEYVGKLRERETPEYQAKIQAEEQTNRFVSENLEYANRLKADHGLSEADILRVGRFAKALHEESGPEGQRRFVPLEEAWREMQRYGNVASSKPSTPRSLRAHSATPGIPGGSVPPERDKTKKYQSGDLSAHMMRVLKKAQ